MVIVNIRGTAYGIVVNKADDDGAVAGDYIVDDYLFRPKFFHSGYVMSIFISNYMSFKCFLFRSNIDLIGASLKISIYTIFMDIYRKRTFQIHPTP